MTDGVARGVIVWMLAVSLFSAAPAMCGEESAAQAVEDWAFDWHVRTDRDGKPAGHYELTPYPITEKTSSYTITNDEGRTTYALGEKHYVDGGYAGGASDGSWERPWVTLRAALTNAPEGNTTIIVRGAREGFDGQYDEVGLIMKTGLDDTHRFMVVGYGQERPIIKGCHVPDPHPQSTFKWPYGTPTSYTTLQRVKIQDNFGNGVRSCQNDAHINVIDVWLHNNCKYDFAAQDQHADGNLYFLGSDHCYVRHCTSERTAGHALKIGDGADYPVVEWSVAREFGYWQDFPIESYWAHPSGFDFPNDTPAHVSRGIKLRYCIAHTGLYYAVQIRTKTHGGHDIKYNEIWDTTHYDDVKGAREHGLSPGSQVLIYTAGETDFHNNIVRDPGDGDASGIGISAAAGTIRIRNNLIYNHNQGIRVRSTSADVIVRNNSLYCNNDQTNVFSTVGDKFTMQNNILYQAGPGTCAQMVWTATKGKHSHNRYYFPKGSRGCELGAGESDGDPGWAALPVGPYRPNACRLKAHLPGLDLSEFFTDDFHGVHRVAWDVGACERR
jgi:hypothetical protein